MVVKRKIRKIPSKSLIPYFLNSLNNNMEILVKRSPKQTYYTSPTSHPRHVLYFRSKPGDGTPPLNYVVGHTR